MFATIHRSAGATSTSGRPSSKYTVADRSWIRSTPSVLAGTARTRVIRPCGSDAGQKSIDSKTIRDATTLAEAIDALDPEAATPEVAEPEIATPSQEPLAESDDDVPKLHAALQTSATLRKLAACSNAPECLALFVKTADEAEQIAVLSEPDCLTLISAAFDRGNVDLALSIYDAMGRVPNANMSASMSSVDSDLGWPAATLKSTEMMVLLLARELRVKTALDVVARIRSRGMPASDEVPFGVVVESPLAPGKPLTVIQSQEGTKIVGCAESRFEFETFSGFVTDTKSEALNADMNFFQRLIMRSNVCQAVHELVVKSPEGRARTFRLGTSSANVPAQVGERVTIISSPAAGSKLRKDGFLSSRPPKTKPGEPMSVLNHATAVTEKIIRPPSGQGLPQWLIPVVGTLVLGDAGSGLFDPNLPLLVTGGAVFLGTSFVGGNQMLLPRLKQLPQTQMAIEETRQQLLEQHSALVSSMKDLNASVSDEIRSIARLWQLQVKMQSVGGGAYDARLDRVVKARSEAEAQLSQRLKLLEGYTRIASMIEIEVEMNTQVPENELVDIERQIQDLRDVEELQAEWTNQVEAEDELERLLRQ